MEISLIGLPKVGKTTIFNALTGLTAEISDYVNNKTEPNLAIIDVLDERIEFFTEMYQPKKTVYATIKFIDFIGLQKPDQAGSCFSTEAMNLIKNVHALGIVLRNFSNDVLGDLIPPNQQLLQIEEDLLLADLIATENRLKKIEETFQRGKKTPILEAEKKLFEKIQMNLNDNQPIRNIYLNDDEEKILRGYQLLTQKPVLVILNSDEKSFGKNQLILQEIEKTHQIIEFAGQFEMELSSLEAEEKQVFMEDMGLKESARERLTQFAQKTLGYINFFTVGTDEVRAWSIPQNSTALNAAAAIHNDLARGFIRAECFNYQDLKSLGSEKAIKEKGLLRLEGKEYFVKDGDILCIRFSV